MKKRRRIFVIVSIIIIFVICILSLSKVNKDEFVIEVGFDDFGNAYTLSYDNNNVYLKKINEDKKIEWCNKTLISKGNEVVGKSNLIVTPEGRVITYTYRYNSSTSKKVNEQIYIYSEDGSEKRLILNDISNATEEEESILSINYYKGVLLFSQDTHKEVNGKQLIHIKKIDLEYSNKLKESEIIKTIDYDADIGINRVICINNQNIIYSTFNSDIYMVENEGIKQIYSSKQKDKQGLEENHKITNLSYDNADNIYFLDTVKNEVLKGNIKNYEINILFDNKTLNNLGMDYGQIDQVKFVNSRKFYALMNDDSVENNKICLYDNGQIIDYNEINYSFKYLFIESLKLEIKIILIIVALFFTAYVIKKLTSSKLTVSLKQIIIVIPVISLSVLVMIYKCNDILTKIVEKQLVEQIYQISREKLKIISGDEIKNIDWNFPYKDKKYIKLKKELNISENNYDGYKFETKMQIDTPHNSMYTVLYPVRNNDIYTGISDYNYVNIPIDFIYSNEDLLKYKKCVEEKTFLYGNLKDFEGEWIGVILPIVDSDDHVTALIEIGITKQGFINDMISSNVHDIFITNTVISIITIIALLIGLYFLLRPLKKLKEGVLNIQNGKLGIHVEIKGNDEISDISKVFNDMSDNLKNEMEKLTKINEAYYRFVPLQMFELLNKNDVLDVNIGDQMKTKISLLSMSTNNFKNFTDKLSSNEIFVYINKIFGTVAKRIYECNGVIERYNNSGLIALYQNGSADAVKCAVKIKDTVKNSNDKMLLNADIGFIINKEEIMIGIIGGHNRISASVVSDYLSIIENLNLFGKKFGSSILVTENSIEEINSCKIIYNYRKIGNIKYKNKNEITTVYDFFDGDLNYIINLKKQTKEIFEQGVEHYLNKDFYSARRCFIEVLKEYKNDKASKEYLILCDKYYKIEDTVNIETYLEIF